jgi:hypothetical protein
MSSFVIFVSPCIIRIIKSRKMRWAEHVARMGQNRNVYRVPVRKPEGKKQLRRPSGKWQYNINVDLKEIACEDMECIHFQQDRERFHVLINWEFLTI